MNYLVFAFASQSVINYSNPKPIYLEEDNVLLVLRLQDGDFFGNNFYVTSFDLLSDNNMELAAPNMLACDSSMHTDAGFVHVTSNLELWHHKLAIIVASGRILSCR